MSDSNKSSLYFKKIINLVINIGTDTLRARLYFEVPKSTIIEKLCSYEIESYFRLLRSRKCITTEEFDKLTRSPNPDTYDISLLILLMTNGIIYNKPGPSNGWNQNPDDSDLSLGADLMRLREIRNEMISQKYIVNMTETHFEGLWVRLKRIFRRIAARCGTDAKQNITLKIKTAKMTMAVNDDNALKTFIHWYEQDTNDFQQRLSVVRESLKDLSLKVDTPSRSFDEETTRNDHETLQSKVKETLQCSRLIGLTEFEIVGYGNVDTMRNALPFLDETVTLIAEIYYKIMNIWTEFKIFCNSGLPAEILRMDEKSIELYKKALAEGSVPDFNIRLMIVGHVNVGKTTLKRRLFGESVNIEERQSTKGIEVHVGRCQVDMLSKEWQVQEKDGRMDALYQRLVKLLRRQDSPLNPTKPSEVPFQREDNEKSNLADSHVDVLYESSSSLNLDNGLPSQIDQEQLITPRPMPRKPNDPKQTSREKESCFSDLKEILNQSARLDKSLQTAELSIWDFAGQSDFYAMHQVFLSRRAVYLLVTNLTEHISSIVEDEFRRDCKGDNTMKIIEYIEFWLNSIYEHTQRDVHKEGPNQIRPNVIMVGTHADKLKKDNTEEPCVDFINTVWNYLDGKVTFDLLTDEYFRIDNTIDPADPARDKSDISNISDLRTYIFETASKQSFWGQMIPAKWCNLEQILLKLQIEGAKSQTKRSSSILAIKT